MHDEEIIDTSDVEENIDASQYWRKAASRARSGYARLRGARMTDGERSPKRLKSQHRSSQLEGNFMDCPSSQSATMVTPTTSFTFASISHAQGVQQNHQVDVGVPATPLRLPNYRIPLSGSSPRTSMTKDSPPSSSPGAGLPPPTSSLPSNMHGEQPESRAPDSPLLPRTPYIVKALPTASSRHRTAGPSVHNGTASETLITILRATSISPSHTNLLQQIPPHVRRSRSRSPDPLQLLSSPPLETQASALRRPRNSPLKEIPNSILDSTQPQMRPKSPQLSQILPLASPVQHPSHPARSHFPAPTSPPGILTSYEDEEEHLGRAPSGLALHDEESAEAPASPPPIQAVEPVTRLPGLELDGGRRYPLRARTKQQEHPYLYDHIAYKKQLHSNPEAIVKNRELERLRRLTEPDDSQNDGPDADGEFVAGEDSQEQTQDWAMDVDQESQIYLPTRRRSHSRSHHRTVASRPITTPTSNGDEGAASVEHPPVTAPLWEPAAFQETFSSEDDVPSINARKVRGGEEKTHSDAGKIKRRRKRLAPFPLPLTPKSSDHGERSSPEPSSSNILHSPVSTPLRPRLRRHSSSAARHFSALSDTPEPIEAAFVRHSPPADNPNDRSDRTAMDINASDDEDSSPSSELSDGAPEDRAKIRALNRMMPTVMANKLMGVQMKKPASNRRQNAKDDDDPLTAGQTRTRIASRNRTHEIRGDEESEIEISSSSSHGSDDDGVDDSDLKEWLEDPKPSAPLRSNGSTRRDQIVDFMLSRTTTSRRVSKKAAGRRSHPSHDRGATSARARRSTSPGHSSRIPGASTTGMRGHGANPKTGLSRAHVVTAGVRRFGLQRQTTLPFIAKALYESTIPSEEEEWPSIPAGEDQVESGDPRRDNVHWVRPTDGAGASEFLAKRKRQKTKRSERNRGQTYTFAGDRGRRITSGRPSHAVAIQMQDEGFHHMLAPPPSQPPGLSKKRPYTTQRRLDSFYNPVKDSDINHERNEVIDVHYDNGGPHISSRATGRGSSQTPVLHAVADCDVPLLVSGSAFAPNTTYLGRPGFSSLLELLKGSQPQRPQIYNSYGIFLDPDSACADCVAALELATDRLVDYIKEPEAPPVEIIRRWDVVMHAYCEHVSWHLWQHQDDNSALVQQSIIGSIEKLRVTFQQDSDYPAPSVALYSVGWFVLELALRLGVHSEESPMAISLVEQSMTHLLENLLELGFDGPLKSVADADQLEDTSVPERVAEVWICLLHVSLVQGSPSSEPPNRKFWDALLEAMASRRSATGLAVMASEETWKTMFSLCALSQFSAHGVAKAHPMLPASWQVVSVALKSIQLSWDPRNDQELQKDRNLASSLRKRDAYIPLVISRCFLLCTRWRWSLDDANASGVFNQLLGVFRSRRFSNLLGESYDFPKFLRENDMSLLSERRKTDTAFGLLLKLVARAAVDYRQASVQGGSAKLRKLLSMAIPVGAVSYASVHAPTARELSMLYNRLSAVAVAIYVDPTEVNATTRLAHARKYVNFNDADFSTRQACIRGMMHLAILLQKMQLNLDGVLNWAGEMTETLMDEFAYHIGSGRNAPAQLKQPKQHLLRSLQLLLGSIRKIIDAVGKEKRYPDPRFLTGPWITRLLSSRDKMIVLEHSEVCYEVRRLVQAFLEARAIVTPAPARPSYAPRKEESQESQEDYGEFDVNLWDVAFAELGDDHSPENPHKENDVKVSKIMNDLLVEKMYMFVCKFLDPSQMSSLEDYEGADKWVDCWVGCASVVVQHNLRDWSYFVNMGGQSWARIMDTSWRRRVGLRFMFMMLKLDPLSYPAHSHEFLKMLFESLVTAQTTLEHQYASLLFSVDQCHSPILHGIRSMLPEMMGEFHLSKADFTRLRLSLLERMAGNLAEHLAGDVRYEPEKATLYQVEVEMFVGMLSAMKQTCVLLEALPEGRASYTAFCHDAHAKIAIPGLRDHPRLRSLLEDIRTVL